MSQPAADSSPSALLRVSYIWRDEVMDDAVLTEPEPVTLGSSADASFTTPDLGLPADFAIIRPGARGYVLTLGQGMSGRVRIGGVEQEVSDFLAKSGGEGGQGAFRASGVGPGDWGVIHLDGRGEHSFFFQFVRPDPPLPLRHWKDLELMLPSAAFAVILVSVFLIIAMMNKPEHHSMVFPGRGDLLASYLVNRPPPPTEPVEEPKAGTEDGEKEAEPASTAGEAGKSGGEGEKPRKRAPDPDKGEPDEVIPKSLQRGLLSQKSREQYKKTLDRGGFDKKLGNTLARLQGKANQGGPGGYGPGSGTGVGPGKGTGTLTKGTGKGPGGGGTAHADVVTQKSIKTGGKRAARGTPTGKGLKEAAVVVKTGKAGGDLGGLTHEQILKVIRSRQNAIKTCYDRELQRTPGLGGKIVIQWKINPAGQVVLPRVKSTTMNNGRVEDCIVRQISRLKFPSPKKMAVVKFPFIFSSR